MFVECSFKTSPVYSSKALPRRASGSWKPRLPYFLDQLDHSLEYLRSGPLGEIPDAWWLPLERPRTWSELLVLERGCSQRPAAPVPRCEPSAGAGGGASRSSRGSEGEGIHHPHHDNVPQRRYDGDPEQDGVVGGPWRLLWLTLAVGGRVHVGGGVKEGVLGAEVLVGRVHEGASHHGQLGRRRERIKQSPRELGGCPRRGSRLVKQPPRRYSTELGFALGLLNK